MLILKCLIIDILYDIKAVSKHIGTLQHKQMKIIRSEKKRDFIVVSDIQSSF